MVATAHFVLFRRLFRPESAVSAYFDDRFGRNWHVSVAISDSISAGIDPFRPESARIWPSRATREHREKRETSDGDWSEGGCLEFLDEVSNWSERWSFWRSAWRLECRYGPNRPESARFEPRRRESASPRGKTRPDAQSAVSDARRRVGSRPTRHALKKISNNQNKIPKCNKCGLQWSIDIIIAWTPPVRFQYNDSSRTFLHQSQTAMVCVLVFIDHYGSRMCL
nr:hypothetical protein CFP56_26934 [Quercus suber]